MAFRSPRLASGSARAWSTTSSSFAKLADLSTSDPARIAVVTSNWSRRPVSRISGGQPASCNRLSAISHAPCEGRSRSSSTAARLNRADRPKRFHQPVRLHHRTPRLVCVTPQVLTQGGVVTDQEDCRFRYRRRRARSRRRGSGPSRGLCPVCLMNSNCVASS